jgi:hypothetical protein
MIPSSPNQAAPGKGAIACWFQIERITRALPEQHRWASKCSVL